MSLRKACAGIATVLAFSATGAVALAQDSAHEQRPPAAAAATPTSSGMPMGAAAMHGGMRAMGGMPMMGMGQMMMGQMMGPHGMAGHVEGRIAYLKAELKVTDAQLPLWNPVAEAMRANAKETAAMPNTMAMTPPATPLPDRLATREKMMTAYLESLRKLEAAVGPLYAALDSDQKKTADELMLGPMGMGTGMCMMSMGSS